MNEQIRLIADRIRGLRDIAKLSVETCAGDLGIPADTYRSYESGQADIPASFLYQIAHKFHVDLTSLLTGEEPRLHVYAVTRAGKVSRWSGGRTTATRALPTTSSTGGWNPSSLRSLPGRPRTPYR